MIHTRNVTNRQLYNVARLARKARRILAEPDRSKPGGKNGRDQRKAADDCLRRILLILKAET